MEVPCPNLHELGVSSGPDNTGEKQVTLAAMLWGGGPSGVAKEAPERHKVTGSSNVKVASNLSDPPAVPQEAMTGLELGDDEAEDNQKDEQTSETPEQKPQGLKEKSSDALAATLTKPLRDAQTSKRSVQEWHRRALHSSSVYRESFYTSNNEIHWEAIDDFMGTAVVTGHVAHSDQY
ncbi:hypothetical protein JG688_00012388 [Phytophthora aleatoria]|uniref:Uncharacterized protein n=1 Tax=Phytophthora aleatoria TaxID=2496075 RepID=A0A8J5IAY9_9STRA|nr:hypothetical protein JG688_00012388 [Phytophthora aleatoria]